MRGRVGTDSIFNSTHTSGKGFSASVNGNNQFNSYDDSWNMLIGSRPPHHIADSSAVFVVLV
jgi:hypothetical protein